MQRSYEYIPRRVISLALLAFLVSAVSSTAAFGAAARKPCGLQVLDDWYGSKTGQLSRTYPLGCYRDALRIVDSRPDTAIYSNAPDDITKAMELAAAGRGLNGPPSGPPPPGGSLPSFLGGPDAKNGGHAPTHRRSGVFADPGPTAPGSTATFAVPLPALVLAAIAVLLLTLGVSNYLVRAHRAASG
jgi:hypothetical protein